MSALLTMGGWYSIQEIIELLNCCTLDIYPHITLWKTEGKIGVFRSKIDDGTWVILQEQQPNYKVSDFHFGERIPRIPILLSFLDCI